MLYQTGIWQTKHHPTTPTISALRGDLDNSGGTAAEAGLCLRGTFAAHCGDGGANSWEIRSAAVAGVHFVARFWGHTWAYAVGVLIIPLQMQANQRQTNLHNLDDSNSLLLISR